jgi:mono/diheme cytochrome c family protein
MGNVSWTGFGGLFLGVAIFAISGAHAQDLAAGKKLYIDNCQRCHSAKGQGGVGVKLTGDAAYWEFDAFKKAVLMGVDDAGKQLKKPMPLFETVGLTVPKGEIPTDAELHDIQAYIVTFGPKK